MEQGSFPDLDDASDFTVPVSKNSKAYPSVFKPSLHFNNHTWTVHERSESARNPGIYSIIDNTTSFY